MIGLIITIIIGFGIAYFSRQITSGMTVTIGQNVFSNIPLYVITVSTYAIGIIIAWIIKVPQSIATSFRINGLGRNVRSGNNTIAQLQNKISKLEMENTKLRESNNQSVIVNKQADGSYKPNTIQKFLNRFTQK